MDPNPFSNDTAQMILDLKSSTSKTSLMIERLLSHIEPKNLEPNARLMFDRIKKANVHASAACNLVGDALALTLDLILVQQLIMEWVKGSVPVDSEISKELLTSLKDGAHRANKIADKAIDIYSDIKQ
jgi:hypothetical protein